MLINRTLLALCLMLSQTACAQDFLEKWDFDLDGKNDSIYFEYTGGAHCCYHIRIKTSHDKQIWSYEDDMDGGYVMGVDDSYPDKFNIKNYDNDSAPEILMEINSYNGEYYPGAGHILLDYYNGMFFRKDFDLYGYYRSLDSISCTGISGVSGYYISRGDDVIETMLLHSSGLVDYTERPRGNAPWEKNYLGRWELHNDTLSIVYTHMNYEDMPNVNEELDAPIRFTLIYRQNDCMFEATAQSKQQFFKE